MQAWMRLKDLELKNATIAQQAQELEQTNKRIEMMLLANSAIEEVNIEQGAELEVKDKRIEALEGMLSKKLDLIRCGIGGNYSGYPKDNPLYIEVVELLSNTKGEG